MCVLYSISRWPLAEERAFMQQLMDSLMCSPGIFVPLTDEKVFRSREVVEYSFFSGWSKLNSGGVTAAPPTLSLSRSFFAR